MKKGFRLFFLGVLSLGLAIGNIITYQSEASPTYAEEITISNEEELHNYTLASSFNQNTPAITIFTPGLGCGAEAWSNNFTSTINKNDSLYFVEDSSSIIKKMSESMADGNGIELYKMTTDNVFVGYNDDPIKNSDGSEYVYGFASSESPTASPLEKIEFNKHVVIIPQIDMWQEMRLAYEDFEHIVDWVIFNYRKKHSNEPIPSINLVGHSMGGLINMQYAIEHPKNVASLVSLGTPYNGSWYDNWFVNTFITKTFVNQRCIAGTCGHDYYFCNVAQRKNEWNAMYSYNQHIQFYALCGEMTKELWDEMYNDGDLGKYYGIAGSAGGFLLNVCSKFIGHWIFPGDLCVDSDSQKAKGFDGVINFTKKFSPSNCDMYKRCANDVAFPHNLETYDEDMHRCILGAINYGGSYGGQEYSAFNIGVTILAKFGGKYAIRIRNNTGASRSFEYNSKMCFESDAKNWTNLGDIETTPVLINGASALVEISENVWATHLTISYDYYGTRRVFYANQLNGSASTMNVSTYSFSDPKYTKNNMTTSLLSKNGNMWTIKLINNTGIEKEFYYNECLCFENDAKKWENIEHVCKTDPIGSGESMILRIYENGTATDFTISYNDSGTRRIIYAHNLSTSHTMTADGNTATFYSYSNSGTKISLLGKNNGKWLVDLTNISSITRFYEFNSKMCFNNDAKSWSGLSDIVKTVDVPSGKTLTLIIEENAFATSIAVSYIAGKNRKIIYADNLNKNCSLSLKSSTMPYNTYTYNSMKVGIVQKSGITWTIRLVNRTGQRNNFYYNKYMCNYDDAKKWTNLSDMGQTGFLENGESIDIQISENGFATSIAISYIAGNSRKIFYADNLNASEGTMSAHSNNVSSQSYSASINGIGVRLIGKDVSAWLIELTNNTGSRRLFEYNSKMCFEGDAKNWTGLNDKRSLTLESGETNTSIRISENGFATDIAISYEEGENRYIFYAHNLSLSGTMSAYGNIKSNSSSSGNCVVEGTLITLADGSQKPVEELTGDEMLLVWNFETGSYDAAPIMFIDSDSQGHYEVIKLIFSDETEVDVVTEHGFYDKTLNKFVYLDDTANNYIGHNFIKQDGTTYSETTLVDVIIETEVTTTYSPVTYGALCYYVNGMLSMPGGIDGMFNIFDVDEDTMQYNFESMAEDIATYGLLTYEELYEFAPVSREMFDGVNGQYLNIAIGKGLITIEQIQQLTNRYGSFMPDAEEESDETDEIFYSEEYIQNYIIESFEANGYSLRMIIEQYIRNYTGNYYGYIPSSVFLNLKWNVSYDSYYFYATVVAHYHRLNFVFNIRVAH